MNIFLGVYACEPNNGSEPEVGWKMVSEIAKEFPNDTIYAITKANNKDVIEKEGYASNIKFFYYAPPKWLTFWKKGGRGIRIYYYIWLIGAALFMKKQNIKFGIIHHITFVNDWLPSFFWILKSKGSKFIWGPIGSHDPIDFKFLDGSKRKVLEAIRIFLQKFYRNLDPSFHICKYKADCIIGINDNVRKKLRLNDSKYFVSEPAIGVSKSVIESINLVDKDSKQFTIISVGRLIYIKNFKLTIMAFNDFLKSNPHIENAKLKIVGDGADRESLETYIDELGIKKHVDFMGKIPLIKVQEEFAKADLFLFPTLENAGFVIIEAMSHALPVVAMNYGGSAQFIKTNVDKQLVSSTTSYEKIAKNLALKVEQFYTDRKLSQKIGLQNKKDILENFTWEVKAKKMKKLYMELVDEK